MASKPQTLRERILDAEQRGEAHKIMLDVSVSVAFINGHYELAVWVGENELHSVDQWYFSFGAAQEAAQELEAIYVGLNKELEAWAAKQAV